MLKNNFNGGIFGKKLRYRADLEKYQSSVAELENFLVLPYGGIENRPGTIMLNQYKGQKDIRLIPFQFSNSEKFLLAFQVGKIEIFDVNGELVTTLFHDLKDVWNFDYEQKNDLIFIASPDCFPQVIKRHANSNWIIEKFNLKHEPFTMNLDSDITMSVSELHGKNITISCNTEYFTKDHIGTIFRIGHYRDISSINTTYVSDNVSEAINIQGAWSLLSTGSWVGVLHLERSFDSGETWESYRSYASNANNNIDDSGYEDEFGVLYRTRFSGWENAPEGVLYECRVTLNADDPEIFGEIKITAVNFANNQTISREAVGETIVDFYSTDESDNWEYQSWSQIQGYPKIVSFFYGDRLVFANTKKEPQTLWFSQVGNYDEFYNDTQADSAMTWTIATNLYNEINWLVNKKGDLLIGLANQIGILGGKNENEPLSIDNRQYSVELEMSVSRIEPIKVGETLLVLNRGNQALFEIAYDWQNEGYVAPDMTLIAPDVLKSGVRQIAYQQHPYPIIWFVLNDGNLASFTYNRAENVTAWAKHTTQGKFKSVTVLENDTDSDDVFFVVERDFVTYIEKMLPRIDDDVKSMVYTDCSVIFAVDYDSQFIEEISIPHLKGKAINLLIDGGAWMYQIVGDDGKITLPYPAKKVVAGLPYVSQMETLPFEMMNGTESTFAQKKICQNIVAKFYNSVGGEFSADGKNYSPIITRKATDKLGEALTPSMQSIDMSLNSTYNYETVIYFRQTYPLPITLLAIEAEVIN